MFHTLTDGAGYREGDDEENCDGGEEFRHLDFF